MTFQAQAVNVKEQQYDDNYFIIYYFNKNSFVALSIGRSNQ